MNQAGGKLLQVRTSEGHEHVRECEQSDVCARTVVFMLIQSSLFSDRCSGKEAPAALPESRCRRDLGEGASTKARSCMRGGDDETRLGDHAIAVEQQIEIERARRAGKFAPAAETPLGGEQRLQQSRGASWVWIAATALIKSGCAPTPTGALRKGRTRRGGSCRAARRASQRRAVLGFPVAEIGPSPM